MPIYEAFQAKMVKRKMIWYRLYLSLDEPLSTLVEFQHQKLIIVSIPRIDSSVVQLRLASTSYLLISRIRPSPLVRNYLPTMLIDVSYETGSGMCSLSEAVCPSMILALPVVN